MSNEVIEIASKHLGQTVSAYSDLYDKSLLVKVPRELNRTAYGIDEKNLPFCGVDVWNAYEVSALTKKGRPVSGLLKITCDAKSVYHVESKSIKLYLNSFNMSKFGDTKEECVKEIEDRVSADLSELLESYVTCKLHTTADVDYTGADAWVGFAGFNDVENLVDLDAIDFSAYKSDADQLEGTTDAKLGLVALHTDLLRSNCRVTNQPDWGDIYVLMRGEETVTPESFARYVVSHRKVSHFHEEICEMVYKHLQDRFKPVELMVACLYTRRGGIDINPIRASHDHLIPEGFKDVKFINEKTLRQ
tara:strand:+ start:1003 stop:1914 length:912 start_codon:yes stop_codon:yes gene_type:complete